MNKFGKIEEFIESMDVEEVNESGQALLLVEDVFGEGFNLGYCPNEDCSGSGVNVGYCPNTGTC